MLDVGVDITGRRQPSRTLPRLLLNDDGYYWYLQPFFERLEAETGESVELRGFAAFAGDHLTALERMLTEAREIVSGQPEAWEVYVGTQVRPVYCPRYRRVERERFLALLDTWQRAVGAARSLLRPVVCVGS